jgi:hypothetical protein
MEGEESTRLARFSLGRAQKPIGGLEQGSTEDTDYTGEEEKVGLREHAVQISRRSYGLDFGLAGKERGG